MKDDSSILSVIALAVCLVGASGSASGKSAGTTVDDDAGTRALPPATPDVPRREILNGRVTLDGDIPQVPQGILDRYKAFQNVRRAGNLDWGRRGELYVSTRFGDRYQIHCVAGPGMARRQITFFDEQFSDVARRPGSNQLLFSMDKGGDEYDQLYLLSPGTGAYRLVTEGGRSRNRSPRWSAAGRFLVFQSPRSNGKSKDLWLMEAENPSSARVVFKAPDPFSWSADDFTPDARRLLVQRYISSTSSSIHILDLQTGDMEDVIGYPETGGRYYSCCFDSSCTGIFLTTDQKSDFAQLAHLDLATRTLTIITEAIKWDVNEFELSPDGSRAAFVVDAGGLETLYLLDASTFSYVPVPPDVLPKGRIGGIDFSPDGSMLAMTLSSSRTPSDVFTLELGDGPTDFGNMTQWTFSELGGLDVNRITDVELVHYSSFDGRKIPAFVHCPAGEGPFPVLIHLHGGPESRFTPGFRPDIQLLCMELGVAVIAPNVRGSSGYGKEYLQLDNGLRRKDSVADVGALLDWIERQARFDSARVAVDGGSYGGYMVLAAMADYADRLCAGVDRFGISSVVTFLENTHPSRQDLRRVEYGDERKPAVRRFLEMTAPANNTERFAAPIFIYQGANDARVPATESAQMVAALRSKGLPVWYFLAWQEGHSLADKEVRDLYYQLRLLFLERHLVGRTETIRAEPDGKRTVAE